MRGVTTSAIARPKSNSQDIGLKILKINKLSSLVLTDGIRERLVMSLQLK